MEVELQGDTEWPPAFLSVCASSHLLVTRGSALTEEQLMEGNTFHSNRAPLLTCRRFLLLTVGKPRASTPTEESQCCSVQEGNCRAVFSNRRVTASRPAPPAKRRTSLTQGVGDTPACANISLRGKRSSPGAAPGHVAAGSHFLTEAPTSFHYGLSSPFLFFFEVNIFLR